MKFSNEDKDCHVDASTALVIEANVYHIHAEAPMQGSMIPLNGPKCAAHNSARGCLLLKKRLGISIGSKRPATSDQRLAN